MPCIEPESNLSNQEMRAYLQAIEQKANSHAQIAAETNTPLFKVRSHIRELIQLHLVEQEGDTLILTEKGKKRLNQLVLMSE